MTDQPLPLKPCLICGSTPEPISSGGVGCTTCFTCVSTDSKWQNAYGWKLLAAKEAEIKELKYNLGTEAAHIGELDLSVETLEKEHGSLGAEIQEQAVRIKSLEEVEKDAELHIAKLEDGLSECDEAMKILTEALEHYSKGDGMLSYRNEDNTVGFWNGKRAREALDRVRGK